MPLLSDFARRKKIEYFLKDIPQDANILEIGSGSGWLKQYFSFHGYTNYLGIDIVPPADIVGSIFDWELLGIKKASFDVIIAFEVIEHVNCLQPCFDLMKPNAKLFMTSPVPEMDWLLRILEKLGLNQKRTSKHTNLTKFDDICIFREKKVKIVSGLSQWGVFTKS
jgi:2-polyprenyl-3-methyl-5-hydroxy-6-metoxy-1,4-benzoquinol methylase